MTHGRKRYIRMTRDARTLLIMNSALAIAYRRGIVAVSAESVARYADCHPNLVRVYVGKRAALCRRVALMARERGYHQIVIDARNYGFLE